MKVLAAIIAPPHLSASGAVRAGRQLSRVLAPEVDITIASMSAVDRSSIRGPGEMPVAVSLPAPLRPLPGKYRTLFYRSDIPKLIRRGGWDLVHLHNPTPGLEMARVAAACTHAGIPYVVSTHGYNEVRNGETVYGFGAVRRLVWQTCMLGPVARVTRQASAMFLLSPADEPIVRSFGFSGPVITVPNGVDLPDRIDPAAERAVCDRFGLQSREAFSGITCMFLANHTPNKGVPVLLDAFARLDCPFQLIVGGERRADIDYRLSDVAKRPGQHIVLTGSLTDAEVSALMRRADLFVFPTRADSFPLVVLEAMAHGCAVLASDVGGIPYQIDGSCGEVLPPGDAGALATAVTRLAAQPERLASMGRHAAGRVEQQFTWRAASTRALEGYRMVLREATSAAVARRPSTRLAAISQPGEA